MVKRSRNHTLMALGVGALLAGCGDAGTSSNPGTPRPMDVSHVGDATTFNPAASGLPYSATNGTPVDPTVDYHLALRTASLKLRGNLPSLLEQENLKNAIDSGNADDAQNTYESLVKGYINNSPALFNKQMFHF